MLRRTADSLFWLSRYVERADYLARILEAANRLASLPKAELSGAEGETEEWVSEWESALRTAGCLDIFRDHYEVATAETVTDFLAFSDRNPFSIRRCLEIARANARAVRTALTTEMWEAINGAWLELQQLRPEDMDSGQITRFLDWVKEVSLRVDGSGHRTMLRRDSYWFARLGIYLERADNTARILDVKYHVLLPQAAQVGGGLDYAQWAAILRAVSALTSYHWVYRESVKPWLVADLLILNGEMPRSLVACYAQIVGNLDNLAGAYGRLGDAQRQSRQVHLQLEHSRVDQIFQSGLHEFLGNFIDSNNRVGQAIAEQYLI
ncbi:MAG: alpha-E domain-containing protein [Dongiaceae bacterium]